MLQNSPIRNAGRTWTRDNLHKANRFQKHLEMIFQPNDEDKWMINGLYQLQKVLTK